MSRGFVFEEATREKTKARLAVAGPAGAGKTRWALEMAMILAGPNGKVAVIDTENRSASLYVGVNGIRFKAVNLESYSIQNYLDCIAAAEDGMFDVLVIDSLSHAWAGEGGALEQVDRVKGNNAFTNGWGTVTPLQNQLTNALTHCKAHLIVTLQVHQAYELQDQRNKKGDLVKVPVRLGMAPIQRKGMEYLFSIYGEVDLEDHTYVVSKSRLDPIKKGRFSMNSLAKFTQTILEFHNSGAEMSTEEPPAPEPEPQTKPATAAATKPAAEPPPPPSFSRTWQKHDGKWANQLLSAAPPGVLLEYASDVDASLPKLKTAQKPRVEAHRAEVGKAYRTAIIAHVDSLAGNSAWLLAFIEASAADLDNLDRGADILEALNAAVDIAKASYEAIIEQEAAEAALRERSQTDLTDQLQQRIEQQGSTP